MASVRVLFAISTVASCLAIAACGSFSGSDPEPADGGTPGEGGQPQAEAGGEETGKPTDDAGATDAGGNGANVLTNGDFELGCGIWQQNGATLTADTTARSGGTSCLVCGNAGLTVWSIYQTVDAVPGATYTGEAWVRAPSTDASATATAMSVSIAVESATNLPQLAETPGPASLEATWKKGATAIARTDKQATTITLGILSRAAGGCFLVDDAVLRRPP